jgi:uncharacterized protein with ParB-like and HNH nuclease domain
MSILAIIAVRTMSKISKAADISVEDYFRYPALRIPQFQREYVWEIEEIEEFWEDLTTNGVQFLGSIILNDKEYDGDTKKGILEIVDGQQRTVSLILLLGLISHKLMELVGTGRRDFEKNAAKQAESINTLISESDRDDMTRLLSYKLVLPGPTDNEDFRLVLSNEQSASKKGPYYAFKSAWSKLDELIAEYLKELKGREERIKRLIALKNHILDIKIIEVRVSTDEDAYMIFETVNARGADLGAADLLKNHLFQKVSDKKPIQTEWDRVKKILADVDRRGLDMTGFLRYYWIGKYEHVSKKGLYRSIKKVMRDSESKVTPEGVLKEIAEFGNTVEKIYSYGLDEWRALFGEANIQQPRAHEWFSFKKNLDFFPKSIQYLPIYNALVSEIEKIDKNKPHFIKLLLAIEKVNFLYSYVHQKPTNKIDKMLSGIGRNIRKAIEERNANNVARAVRDGEKDITDFLIKNLDRVAVDNFVAKLSWKSSSDKKIMNFILINLEYALGGYARPLLKDDLSLEHIYPKSVEKKRELPGWPKPDFEYAALGHGMGNITLLPVAGPHANNEAGEELFDIKKALYGSSAYALNRYFADIPEWNGARIEKRLKFIQEKVWERWGVEKKEE